MTKRQQAIFDLLQNVPTTADVGCDHGILSLNILERNISSKVIATDISAPSLQKTKDLLNSYNLASNAEFYCVDGLPRECKVDQILIAGMGGNEICKILSKYLSGREILPVLVLQPMRDFFKVRKMLMDFGYKIVVDKIIFDKKFYLLLKAEPGVQQCSTMQLYFGVIAQSYVEKDYQMWLDSQIQKANRILPKIEHTDKYEDTKKFLQICYSLKECKKC